MVSLKNLNVYTNGNFFLEIQSDGSIVPTIFNRDFVTVKKYTINRQDTFTGNLWQKSNKKIIDNQLVLLINQESIHEVSVSVMHMWVIQETLDSSPWHAAHGQDLRLDCDSNSALAPSCSHCLG